MLSLFPAQIENLPPKVPDKRHEMFLNTENFYLYHFRMLVSSRRIILRLLMLTTIMFSCVLLFIRSPQISIVGHSKDYDDVINSLSSAREKERCFLVIIIPSRPQGVKTRIAIRSTWANVTRWDSLRSAEEFGGIKFMFILGEEKDGGNNEDLEKEMSEHQDIYIVQGLQERRTVLKYKVLWAMKQSLYRFNYTYLLKTDDDVLVNLPVLLNQLIALPRHHLYTGACQMRYGGFSGYPTYSYCSGGGYVLSRDVVEEMQDLPERVEKVPFQPEDGYVGWLVYNLMKIKNFKVHRLTQPGVLRRYFSTCGPFEKTWFFHEITSPDRMNSLFKLVNSNSYTECLKRT